MSSRKSRYTEWVWEEEHGRWFRWHYDKHGRAEPQYSYPEVQPEENVPRTPAETTEQVTDQFARLNVADDEQTGGNYDDSNLGAQYEDEASESYVLDPSGAAEDYGSSQKGKGKGKGKAVQKSRHGHDKRGRGHYHQHDAPDEHDEEPPFYKKTSGDDEQGGYADEYQEREYPSGHGHAEADERQTVPEEPSNIQDEGHGHAYKEDPQVAPYSGEADAADYDTGRRHGRRRVRFQPAQQAEEEAVHFDPEEEEDAQLQAALEQSRRSARRGSRAGQASTDETAYDDVNYSAAQSYDDGSQPRSSGAEYDDGGTYVVDEDDYEAAGGGGQDDEVVDEGGQPEDSALDFKPDITGTEGDFEELDPRYKVEPSSAFQPGRIFKVLWSEPAGYDLRGFTEKRTYQDAFGVRFYVGFRRFIIIGGDQGHCTCVPILTYGGKACTKRGVKANKHGIIFQNGKQPGAVYNEPRLGFKPIRMQITAKGEKLSKESRVNYSKLMTIEHNVKVFFVGYLEEHDLSIAFKAVNKCWADKNFQGYHHSQ